MNIMQTRIGGQQIGIILLTATIAAIHISLAVGAYTQDNDIGTFIMFTLNGLGYLTLLAATFLPLPVARDNPKLVRWVFIGYVAMTILAWVVLGDKSWPAGALGYITKLIELSLITLLWLERRKA